MARETNAIQWGWRRGEVPRSGGGPIYQKRRGENIDRKEGWARQKEEREKPNNVF
jgi:hypothetical protein